MCVHNKLHNSEPIVSIKQDRNGFFVSMPGVLSHTQVVHSLCVSVILTVALFEIVVIWTFVFF